MLKYAKTLLEKGIQQEEIFRNPNPLASYDHSTPIEHPETIIAENVTIKGTLAFHKLLRIDGLFEGELESQGRLIIGPSGQVKAHIELEEAIIAGKVEGNITVKKRLILRGHAKIIGNITAPFLSVEEGVSIIGQVYVTAPEAPPEADIHDSFSHTMNH